MGRADLGILGNTEPQRPAMQGPLANLLPESAYVTGGGEGADRHRTQDMENVLMVVQGFFAAFGASVFALVTYILGEALYYQVLLAPTLERDLGFRHGTAYLPDDGVLGYVSAVAIESVTDGSVFQRAGFRSGDVLPDFSHSSLFKSLHRHRGRTSELAVVDGGPGPVFHYRTRRVIRFAVPPRG